jgi:hypothetical protein
MTSATGGRPFIDAEALRRPSNAQSGVHLGGYHGAQSGGTTASLQQTMLVVPGEPDGRGIDLAGLDG